MRVALELIVNFENYLNDEFIESMVEGVEESNDFTIKELCLNTSRSKCQGESDILFDQVKAACKQKEWSGIFHLFAASNALRIKINQVYPAENKCSSIFNFKISPANQPPCN